MCVFGGGGQVSMMDRSGTFWEERPCLVPLCVCVFFFSFFLHTAGKALFFSFLPFFLSPLLVPFFLPFVKYFSSTLNELKKCQGSTGDK